MKTSKSLRFLLGLARAQTLINRKFDCRLGGGLSFTDFQVLYYLSLAPQEQLRRTDLAEKLALTPSGVTRLLYPMEKIGLVTREASDHDARVSYVQLAPGGKQLLSERLEDAELLAAEMLPETKNQNGCAVEDLFGMLKLGYF
ncbi:MAG: MarR family transcriptional regulator [Elusimicrobiales bacterium]|nr:MarR family transcriptional regulator [Elusimicrobiales bacterium]